MNKQRSSIFHRKEKWEWQI